MKWATLTVDGQLTVHQGLPQLGDLQGAVGGYIEALYGDDVVMFIDEEGKLKGKPANKPATAFGRSVGISPLDTVVGDVAFTGYSPASSATLTLTDEAIEQLRKLEGVRG